MSWQKRKTPSRPTASTPLGWMMASCSEEFFSCIFYRAKSVREREREKLAKLDRNFMIFADRYNMKNSMFKGKKKHKFQIIESIKLGGEMRWMKASFGMCIESSIFEKNFYGNRDGILKIENCTLKIVFLWNESFVDFSLSLRLFIAFSIIIESRTLIFLLGIFGVIAV